MSQASRFVLYSTDIDATTSPADTSPAPASIAVFGTDPVIPGRSTYESQASAVKRGSVFKTLGGVQFQDFGTVVGDDTIKIADTDALVDAVVTAIRTMYNTVNTEWYFTDGSAVWKVRFAFNNGFRAWRNELAARSFWAVYSYEINLIITGGPY